MCFLGGQMVVRGLLVDLFRLGCKMGVQLGVILNTTSTIPLRQLWIVTNDVFAFFDEN